MIKALLETQMVDESIKNADGKTFEELIIAKIENSADG